MKKILTSFIFLLLISSLIACSNLFDTSEKIEVEVDFTDYSIKSISNDLEAKVNLLTNFISLQVTLDDKTQNHGLNLNGKNINANDFTKVNNILTYNFKASDYLKPDDTLPLLVKLDANSGLWGLNDLKNQTPDFDFDIKSFNNEDARDLAIFTTKTIGLRWYYKLFIKFDDDLNTYKVVFADPRNAAIENLNLPDYDFILGLHHHSDLLKEIDDILVLFSDQSVNRPMILDSSLEDLSGTKNLKFYSNTPDFNNYELLVKDDSVLPTPMKSTYNFIGWSDGVSITDSIKPNKVSDDTYMKVLTAQFSGLSMTELKNYLTSLIPSFIDADLVLPQAYSDYMITWESSNEDALSADGTFTNSFSNSSVTLTANISKSDGTKNKLQFDAEVKMMKSIRRDIASGYVYRGYEKLPDLLFETLDIINTAFIDVDTNGNLNGNAFLSNVKNYVMPRAKQHGNYVILVVGPASEPSIWSQVARDTNKINRMADQIVEVINEYGFHGVDIDWEWPGTQERTNFTKLIKVIYEKVKANNRNHIVTAAIAGGQWQMPNYDLQNSGQYLDYVNVMTYGLVSNGGRYQNPLKAATSWHNSTLKLGASTNTTSIEESIRLFNQNGIENKKLIIGLAFYGIKQVRTKNDNNTYTEFTNAGSMNYSDIVTLMNHSNYTYVYDQRAGVPYIYKNDGTEFISFDDPRSVKEKGTYTKANGLAGMMFWEFGTDTTYQLLEALKESMNK